MYFGHPAQHFIKYSKEYRVVYLYLVKGLHCNVGNDDNNLDYVHLQSLVLLGARS